MLFNFRQRICTHGFIMLCSFLLAIMESTVALANKLDPPVSIAFLQIENLYSGKRGELPYDKLWNLADKQLELPFDVHVYPAARAFNQFSIQKHDCIFPSDKPKIFDGDSLLYSKTVNHSAVYLVSLKNGTHYRSLLHEDLHKVAVQRGYFTRDIIRFRDSQQRVDVNTIEQQIGLLKLKRVDAILVLQPDMALTIDAQSIKELWYDPSNPLSIEKEQLVCWDNKQTRKFIAAFNQWISTLNLANILGPANTDLLHLPSSSN